MDTVRFETAGSLGILELALARDLIWASTSARFGEIEAMIGTTTLLGR